MPVTSEKVLRRGRQMDMEQAFSKPRMQDPAIKAHAKSRAKRTALFIRYKRKTLSLAEWAESTDIPKNVLWSRLKQLTWTTAQILGFEPPPSRKRAKK